jgi:hypothetical protein
MFDIAVRNGKVIDGTGNPWFRADVGIIAEKIVSVGKIEARHPHALSRIRTSQSVYVVYSKSKNTNNIKRKMVVPTAYKVEPYGLPQTLVFPPVFSIAVRFPYIFECYTY